MKRKPTIGRPPLPKGDRQDVLVSFRLTSAERWLIGHAAKRRGEKLSTWIKATLIATAECESTELPPGAGMRRI